MSYIKPKENESYKDYINRILINRDNAKDELNYQERHHIIPKCKGGDNSENNLIYLYPEEHYYAHKLLAYENPEENKLQYAWWCMCSTNGIPSRIYSVTPEEYAEARRRVGEVVSKNRRGANNPNFGKNFTEEHKRKLAASHVGKPRSAETVRKMSEHHADVSGANNPRAVKVVCLNTGQVFYTLAEAMNWCGLHTRNGIVKCAQGKQDYAGKHPITKERLKWKYTE